MKIAHITPHMGGGVGRVLTSYLSAVADSDVEFSLYCLDYLNDGAAAAMARAGIKCRDRLGFEYKRLAAVVAEADITVVHWWNHPLIYAWIFNGIWPPGRLLFWAHVSGQVAPQIFTEALVRFPDVFALTTPHALSSPAIKALTEEERQAHIRLLFNCGGLDYVGPPRRLPHDTFRIGYVGTVDYQKMHPDFLEMSLAADLGRAVFTVIGGPQQEMIRQRAEALGAAERFEFLGPVENVAEHLAAMDIFGYPLNPDHYGTMELALLEAQAMGVPPVALAGGAVEFLVGHEISGLLAKDTADYSRCLERLRWDEPSRLRLAGAAPAFIREKFSQEKTVEQFNSLYDELMRRPRRGRAMPPPSGSGSWDAAGIFLHSQGEKAAAYLQADDSALRGLSLAAFSETRGSVFQYHRFFPENAWLRNCAARMEKYR